METVKTIYEIMQAVLIQSELPEGMYASDSLKADLVQPIVEYLESDDVYLTINLGDYVALPFPDIRVIDEDAAQEMVLNNYKKYLEDELTNLPYLIQENIDWATISSDMFESEDIESLTIDECGEWSEVKGEYNWRIYQC